MRRWVPLVLLGAAFVLVARTAGEVSAAGRQGLASAVVQVGLVLLPLLGLAAAARFRPLPSVMAALAWPLVVSWALPRWLPQPERVVEAAAPVSEPPPRTVLVEAPPPKAAPARAEATVRVPFTPGHGVRVPVELDAGAGHKLEVVADFDTGADLTTVRRSVLERLGIDVPRDAPYGKFVNASGGVDEKPLLLLDAVRLGGHVVEGVTVSVCDPCGSFDVLLGMNVARQFRFTVDADAGQLELGVVGGVPERLLDVKDWVDLSGSIGGGVANVSARNRSLRRIEELRVTLSCKHGGAEVVLGPIAPGETASTTAPAREMCAAPRLELTSALW